MNNKKFHFDFSVLCILKEESYMHNDHFLPLQKKYFGSGDLWPRH